MGSVFADKHETEIKRQTLKNSGLMSKFEFEEGCHAKVRYCDLISHPFHMHDGLEILYVIEGSVEMQISYSSFVLEKGDYIIINPYEIHTANGLSEKNVVGIIELDSTMYRPEDGIIMWDCNALKKNTYSFAAIGQIIREILTLRLNKSEDWYEKTIILINNILELYDLPL